MGRPSQSPIWPFLLVVAFLFLLSIVALCEWEHIARRESTHATTDRASEPASAARQLASAAPAVDLDDTARQPTPESSECSIVAADDYCQPSDAPPSLALAPHDSTAEQPLPIVAEESNPIEGNSLRAVDDPRPSTSASVAQQRATQEREVATPAEPSAHSTSSVAAYGPRWPIPVDLLRRLDALSCECECTDWAWQTAQLVVELCDKTTPADERVGEILSQLRLASNAVDALVPNIPDRSVVIELLRVRHSLVRRLDIWELLPTMLGQESAQARPDKTAIDALVSSLDHLDTITRQAGAEGQQWRIYLALDALRSLTRPDAKISDSDARQLARDPETT